MSPTFPDRGTVVAVNVGHGQHYFVVVSDNARNHTLPDVLVCRITHRMKYAGKPDTATLSAQDGLTAQGLNGQQLAGVVLAFRIIELPPPAAPGAQSMHLSPCGYLSATTMLKVDDALRAALTL